MVDLKGKYLQSFKDLHYQKTGVELSDPLANKYFEQLIALVGSITSHADLRKITIPEYGK